MIIVRYVISGKKLQENYTLLQLDVKRRQGSYEVISFYFLNIVLDI